ncbi:hypothetical protein SAMN06265371_104171 [Lutibacter agarilyticus]|uniref:IPT/TIG domain-containing protein n=1 Tax=Lutibacter agarilyticus TaxID=1109740 RepID=A0A238WXY8_9FLAO|nr:hypothetical protein [Lutibacter agarilyticus]SNR51372.1 hypothetical protein SAMN06265371_104171 [Lutibacter agarilyticus]
MKKYFINTIVMVLFLAGFTSCQDDTEYDILWPIPEISSVSSYNDVLSSTITLKGNFTQVKSVYFGETKGDNLQVSADEQSLTIQVPRTMSVDGAPIIVSNEYRQTYSTSEKFVPIIPESSVSEVSDIQVGLTFIVTGENVDLLDEILIDGETAAVVSKGQNAIIVSVAGLDLKAGDLVDVDFVSLAKNDVPTVEKVNVIYPFITYEEVVIWDFADGTHEYIGEPTASVENGDVLGKTANYFSLRAPGYGWDKATGEMTSNEVPDISGIVTPYLTFAVRTPVGSGGYFQMEDQAGNWRHFGYGFDTGGEWVIISQPLKSNWEGGEFNSGDFKPKLGFKAGNAGTNQDLDIAFVKITEGQYDGSQDIGDVIGGSSKPAKIVVMGFEDTENWPDVMNGSEVIGSLDFRKDAIEPFYGDNFFTYVDDGSLGGWGAYWGQTISTDMSSVDLSLYEDPYLSFAVNSIDAQQYIIVRMYQYDEQLVMVQKFFPNTSKDWQTFQFSLFNTDMENWSDDSTDLGAHYKSKTRFAFDVPFDRIEVIVGRAGSNEVTVSIDEMVITEGARY